MLFLCDVLEDTISPIVVKSNHVDPPLSFDVLSRFVSCTYNVPTFSYMDLRILLVSTWLSS